MLKIPKQIYLDELTLTLYTRYAQSVGKSFAAVVREKLNTNPPKINKVKKHTLLDFYGAGKSPYKRRFSAKEERVAFYKAVGENFALEGS